MGDGRAKATMFRAVATEAGLAVVRDVVVVHDEGTGLGAEVVAALDCPPDAVADGPSGGEETDAGLELALRLRPAGVSGWVEAQWPDDDVTWPRGDVADRVLAHVTRLRLDASTAAVSLHAACVVDPSGAAVLLLGPSGAGKSTLAAHLVAAGWDLMSDEQVGWHPDRGRLSGATRPVALKPGGLRAAVGPDAPEDETGPTLLAARALGGRHRLVAAPRAVLVLDRRPATATEPGAVLRPLGPVDVFAALAGNTLDLVRRPDGTAALAELAAITSGAVLSYQEAAAAVAAIGEHLADVGADPVDWAVEVPGGRRRPWRWERGAAVESVLLGDRAALYDRVRRTVLVLNPAAAAVWAGVPGRPRHPDARALLAELADVQAVVPPTPVRSAIGQRAALAVRRRRRG